MSAGKSKPFEMVAVGAPVYGGVYSVTVLLPPLPTKSLPEALKAIPYGLSTPFEIVTVGDPVYGGAYAVTVLLV